MVKIRTIFTDTSSHKQAAQMAKGPLNPSFRSLLLDVLPLSFSRITPPRATHPSCVTATSPPRCISPPSPQAPCSATVPPPPPPPPLPSYSLRRRSSWWRGRSSSGHVNEACPFIPRCNGNATWPSRRSQSGQPRVWRQ